MATNFTVAHTAVIPAPPGRVWNIISTNRFTEWVPTVLEVSGPTGTVAAGATFTERNRALGPLTLHSCWTVHEVQPHRRRVDTGVGLGPLRDVVNVFELEPATLDDGAEGTRVTYALSYRLGLGALGRLLHLVLARSLRAEMRESLANLANLANLINAQGFGHDDN